MLIYIKQINYKILNQIIKKIYQCVKKIKKFNDAITKIIKLIN